MAIFPPRCCINECWFGELNQWKSKHWPGTCTGHTANLWLCAFIYMWCSVCCACVLMVSVHVWTGAGVQWEQEKPTERKLQPGETWPIHPEADVLSAVRLQLVYICARGPLWRWGVELCRSLRALLHPFWAAEVSLNSAVTSSFRRGLCCTVLGLPTCCQLDLQSVLCLHLLVCLQLITKCFPRRPKRAENAGSFTRRRPRLPFSTLP